MKLENVTVSYDGKINIFENFSAEFADGKVTAIVGASGCGKTTLLNVCAGLIPFDGKCSAQSVSYVFQQPRLVGGITVRQNVELVLRKRLKNAAERRKAVEEILAIAELSDKADRYPSELSGGEQQRVAFARAFAYPSEALLMDEPFRSLDSGLKKRLFGTFTEIFKMKPRTVLFVTHDAAEAAALADNVVLLGGRPCTAEKIAEISTERGARDIYSDDMIALRKKIESLTE